MVEEKQTMEREMHQEEDVLQIKRMLTEKPCLGHYAKVKEYSVTTDASTTELGITHCQKQDSGDIQPIGFSSRYLNDNERNYTIGELELFAVVWGLEKFQFYFYGKKVHLYSDHQTLNPLLKRNRSNHHYSARLTRRLNRMAHLDIAVQQIAGSNMKVINFRSKKLARGATIEDKYDEEYKRYILTGHAELNAKYDSLIDSLSTSRIEDWKRTKAEPK